MARSDAIANAARIADFHGSPFHYWWIDDATLLVFGRADYLVDVRTGSIHETGAFHGHPPSYGWGSYAYLSPGGRFLLEPEVTLLRQPDAWWLFESGKRRKMVGRTCDRELAAWMPDGRRWVELHRETISPTVLIRNATDGSVLCRSRANVRDILYTEPGMSISALARSEALGVTPAGRLVTAVWWGSSAYLFQIDANRGEPCIAATVHAPGGGQVRDLALSPRGDRLAWSTVVYTPQTLVQRLLGRWMGRRSSSFFPPGKRANDNASEELWTSRLDGSDARLVGRSAPVDPEYSVEISSVAWSPDGRRISFVRRGGIYAVAAP